MVLRRKWKTLPKGSPEVQDLARKRANQRMRKDILPLLSQRHPRPSSWNPLRTDFNGPSAYGMKLWLADALAMEIMRSNDLLSQTVMIVVEETTNAALEEPKAFVQNIFDQLNTDE